MAYNTDICLRKNIIYQIYPRNFSDAGTFDAIRKELPRIRELGVDIIYLTPIHPIGVEGHKGTLGCPYANRDYRAVNPEQGTLDDFIRLVQAIHAHDMKCIIDVVYNHTSPDSVLAKEHPEFFYHKDDGSFGNRFGDWADVIDLDYTNRALWDYQIESLKMWARYVDGFRCDVATLVPVEFWAKARAECEEIHPGMIWLAETVHTVFNRLSRVAGLHPFSDSEGYQAFDMEYAYDIQEQLDGYWKGTKPLHEWIEMLNAQEAMYPENYIKLRCLENHDQPRIASRYNDARIIDNWHAFLFMMKGTVMLYAGEEYSAEVQPSLFDKDVTPRNGRNITDLLCKLIAIRKEHFPVNGWFTAEAYDETGCVSVRIGDADREYLGLFSLEGNPAQIIAEDIKGKYTDLISGSVISVENGTLCNEGKPLILKIR